MLLSSNLFSTWTSTEKDDQFKMTNQYLETCQKQTELQTWDSIHVKMSAANAKQSHFQLTHMWDLAKSFLHESLWVYISRKTLPTSKALQASWQGHETRASKALLIRIVANMNHVASKAMLQTQSRSWSMPRFMHETWMESCKKHPNPSLKHGKFMYDNIIWAHDASSHGMHGQMTWWTLSMENNETVSSTLVVRSCRARGGWHL